MVETAVVTLTCPQCGGQIHGVSATNVDQTVPCTYCGTELHIPKIGGDVVHERVVVVEKPATPAAPVFAAAPPIVPDYYPPVDDTSLRSSNLGARLVVGFVLVIGMVAFLLLLHSHAQDDLKQMHQRDEADEQCRATCATKCKANPGSYVTTYEAPHVDDDNNPEMRDLDQQVDRQIRDTYVLECETNCEQQQCNSL